MNIDNINNQKIVEFENYSKVNNYPHFTDTLKKSLAKVNNLQHKANQAGIDLALGKANNIHSVMIAAQKAKLSLDLTTTITNKALDAYKEIMRIQV
jgi:flagellar hook-basal body complex protein FliE